MICILCVFICSFNVSAEGLFQENKLSKTVTFCHLFPSLKVSCVNAVFHCPLWRCALSFLARYACPFFGVTCIRLTAPCFLWRHSAVLCVESRSNMKSGHRMPNCDFLLIPWGVIVFRRSIQKLSSFSWKRPAVETWKKQINTDFTAFPVKYLYKLYTLVIIWVEKDAICF